MATSEEEVTAAMKAFDESPWQRYEAMRAALIAAAQVRAQTHVSVPKTELRDIREMVEHWASYASEYFRDKHDLDGDLAKIDVLLSASGGNCDEMEATK